MEALRANPLTGIPSESEAWRANAACRDTTLPTGLFFSEDLGDIAHAKSVCSACPVLSACLGGALEREEQYGVWGGQLFINGRMVAQKRRRGRPPKVARAEDKLPVIEIPTELRAQAELLSA